MEEARAKLKARLKKTQTGGKGSMRRKKKTKSHIKRTRLSEEEKEFNKIIKKINTTISTIEAEYIELWNIYIDDWMFDMCMDLKRKDFKNKKLDLDLIKEEYMDTFENLINISESEISRSTFKSNYK